MTESPDAGGGASGKPDGGRSEPPRKQTRLGYAYLAIALVMMIVIQLIASQAAPQRIPFSEFRALVEAGKIDGVVVITGDEIRAKLEDDDQDRRAVQTRKVDPDLVEFLEGHQVAFDSVPESTWLPTLLSWILPALVFVGVWMFFIRRMASSIGGGAAGGGLMSIGKSKAKVFVETDIQVRFDDVAGVDEARAELRETVAFLRDPKAYGRLGARMPRGVLLVGPPGTGKTLLARAVAGEANVPFFSISGSEFVEMFVGVGAARVRDLFEQARSKAPCIIFIDELDALGRARAAAGTAGGGHDEKEQTLNQLLVELDGFDPSLGIVLLGATNRPEVLDPALLRAGRFDRQVLVDRPDLRGREAILEVHAKKIRLADGVELRKIAAMSPGFTGADLANLVNEAAITATRRDAEAVAEQDFSVALERIVAGLERKNRLINPRERQIVAHHELGHAFVAAALPSTDPVHKISIVPRGVGALGYTMQRPTEDRFLMTREELEDKMAVLLGGRAAEQVIFGHLSTGAADDLSRATEIARSMVTRYALVPELGNATWETDRRTFLSETESIAMRNCSEAMSERIDDALRRLVDHAFERARAIIAANEDLLRESAARLLEVETLEQDELRGVLGRVIPPRPPESPSA